MDEKQSIRELIAPMITTAIASLISGIAVLFER